MSTQIAVRLPDEMVAELDALIASGQVPSRASVVEAALRRELRQYAYAREAELLAGGSGDADLEALHRWVAGNRPPVD
jgi:Arc/MetJ-type ribon-helix-helix transcriptional regulator